VATSLLLARDRCTPPVDTTLEVLQQDRSGPSTVPTFNLGRLVTSAGPSSAVLAARTAPLSPPGHTASPASVPSATSSPAAASLTGSGVPGPSTRMTTSTRFVQGPPSTAALASAAATARFQSSVGASMGTPPLPASSTARACMGTPPLSGSPRVGGGGGSGGATAVVSAAPVAGSYASYAAARAAGTPCRCVRAI
jgi:hypothetical protein